MFHTIDCSFWNFGQAKQSLNIEKMSSIWAGKIFDTDLVLLNGTLNTFVFYSIQGKNICHLDFLKKKWLMMSFWAIRSQIWFVHQNGHFENIFFKVLRKLKLTKSFWSCAKSKFGGKTMRKEGVVRKLEKSVSVECERPFRARLI